MCKCQYELDRDANILANESFLQMMGLSAGMCKKEKKKKSLCKPRSYEDECITGPQELRRSARIRSFPAPDFPDITNFIDDDEDEPSSQKFVPRRKRGQTLQINFVKRGKPTIISKKQIQSDNNNILSVPKTGRDWMYHSMNELLKQQQCAHV